MFKYVQPLKVESERICSKAIAPASKRLRLDPNKMFNLIFSLLYLGKLQEPQEDCYFWVSWLRKASKSKGKLSLLGQLAQKSFKGMRKLSLLGQLAQKSFKKHRKTFTFGPAGSEKLQKTI